MKLAMNWMKLYLVLCQNWEAYAYEAKKMILLWLSFFVKPLEEQSMDF